MAVLNVYKQRATLKIWEWPGDEATCIQYASIKTMAKGVQGSSVHVYIIWVR